MRKMILLLITVVILITGYNEFIKADNKPNKSDPASSTVVASEDDTDKDKEDPEEAKDGQGENPDKDSESANGLQNAGIDFDKRDSASIVVNQGLEDVGGHWGLEVSGSLNWIAFLILGFDWFEVEWGWEVFDEHIKHRLDADIEGSTSD